MYIGHRQLCIIVSFEHSFACMQSGVVLKYHEMGIELHSMVLYSASAVQCICNSCYHSITTGTSLTSTLTTTVHCEVEGAASLKTILMTA